MTNRAANPWPPRIAREMTPTVTDVAPRQPIDPLTEEAKAVVDNIVALHERVKVLTAERDQERNENAVLKDILHHLRGDLAEITRGRDDYQRYSISTKTQLDTIAKLLLDAANVPAPDAPLREALTPEQLAAFQKDIEQTVAQEVADNLDARQLAAFQKDPQP